MKYEITGIEEEFTLAVGEKINFICRDPDNVKQFKTNDPELLVSKDHIYNRDPDNIYIQLTIKISIVKCILVILSELCLQISGQHIDSDL